MKRCPGLVHLNGNMLASVDVETTGTVPGYHEIVQIAVVPLNSDLQPFVGAAPFYTNLRPEHPERVDLRSWQINGLRLDDLIENVPSQEKAADLLIEWFESLHLPVSKRLVLLAHNWPFECGFLKAWLGQEEMDHVFHYHPRDAMSFAVTLNDKAVFAGRPPPFESVSLSNLCRFFNVENSKPHDALSDACAEAGVYRAMLTANF